MGGVRVCLCLCVYSQTFPSDAVNQLPSGFLTEQRSVSAWGIALLITQKAHSEDEDTDTRTHTQLSH